MNQSQMITEESSMIGLAGGAAGLTGYFPKKTLNITEIKKQQRS